MATDRRAIRWAVESGDVSRVRSALAETINGLYKAEVIHRRSPWKSRESVELDTLEWVAWYNHERLMQPLGYIPPAEAEANYYQQLTRQAAMAA